MAADTEELRRWIAFMREVAKLEKIGSHHSVDEGDRLHIIDMAGRYALGGDPTNPPGAPTLPEVIVRVEALERDARHVDEMITELANRVDDLAGDRGEPSETEDPAHD